MADHEEIDMQFRVPDLRKGSYQAFRIFFLKYYSEFFSFAALLLSDGDSAKNATTSAFLLLWAKHADFDSEKNIRAFLYTTIRDQCLHFLRRLQDSPDASKSCDPDIRFVDALPPGMLLELLVFADRFGN